MGKTKSIAPVRISASSLFLRVLLIVGYIAIVGGVTLALTSIQVNSSFWLGVVTIVALLLAGYRFLRSPLMFGLSLFMISTSLNAVWWNVGIRIRPEQFVAVGLLVLLSARGILSKRIQMHINRRSLLFYGLFVIIASLATLMSVDVTLAVKGTLDFILGYLFVLIVCAVVTNPERLRTAIVIWIVLGVLSAALAFVQLWGYLTRGEDVLLNLLISFTKTAFPFGFDRTFRARGFWGDPNNYAAFLLCSAPLLLSLTIDAWRSKKPYAWWLMVASLVSVSGIILSWSKSSLIGLGLAVIVLLSQWRRYSAKKFVYGSLLLLATALMIGVVILSVPYLRDTAASRFTLEREAGTGGRFEIYGAAIDIFLQSPLLGFGPNNFGVIYARDYGVEEGWGVHSFFVQLLTDTGVLGLFAYLVWYGLILRYAYICARRQNRESRVIGAGLLAAEVGLLGPNLFYLNLSYSCAYVLHALVLLSYGLLRDTPRDSLTGLGVTCAIVAQPSKM